MTNSAAPSFATTGCPALAELTTMRVGGPARRHAVARDEASLVGLLREADALGEPLLVVSGGSNLLVSDEGVPGSVIQVETQGVDVLESSDCGGVLVTVAAGEDWDGFVQRAVTEGWSGIEALSGIPGKVGATPVQNVGAYGQEVCQTIARVRVWDRQTQAVRTLTNAECEFSYRHSVLKASVTDSPDSTPRYVVLDVTFQLGLNTLSEPVGYASLAKGLGVEMGERVPLERAREAVLEQRRARGMVLDAQDHDTWSCGSFFTNPILSAQEYATLVERSVDRGGANYCGTDLVPPRYPAGDAVKTSAAWLIDRAGFTKGWGMPGPAALSTKHTLALTNRGGASASDMVALAREVRDGVQEAFGVRLVNEPVLVGVSL